MAYKQNLPWPRGSVASDGSGITMAETTWGNLEGQLFEVPDTKHGTGNPVVLRAVRNHSGSAITSANKCVRFASGDGDIGRKVAGFCNAQGQVGKPIDDCLPVGTSIASHDLFYVVEAGPCDIVACDSATEAAALVVGTLLTTDSGGTVDNAAASTGDYILGVADETPTVSSTAYRVIVHAGLSATY